MKVKLIGYTQPGNRIHAGELTAGGLDNVQDLVSYCARVSNPSNQRNTTTSEKLLNYLAKHKHWSPFEMASATIEIETTRDIARQMLRHRSFAFQEFSQRYADPTNDLDFVLREARWQDEKNRQNSIDISESSVLHNEWNIRQQKVIDAAKEAYDWAINEGIAKEQARVVLPEGNTVSRLYMQGSIRSWIHYIELRSGNGTQKEHVQLAVEVGKAIAAIFPLATTYINQ